MVTISTFIGRRFAIVIGSVLGGAMIYPWAFIKGIHGSWCIVPIHLSELSPPQFRSLVTGLAYQLGNLCASASFTIDSTLGEKFPISIEGEDDVYDYAKVMLIFMGCVLVYLIIITVIGPENRGADLDVGRDEIFDDDGIHDVTNKSTDSIEHIENEKNEEKNNYWACELNKI